MGILCESPWFPCPGAVKTAICDPGGGRRSFGALWGHRVKRRGGGLLGEPVLGIHQCCTKPRDTDWDFRFINQPRAYYCATFKFTVYFENTTPIHHSLISCETKMFEKTIVSQKGEDRKTSEDQDRVVEHPGSSEAKGQECCLSKLASCG